MAIRTGAEYLEGLHDNREIWRGGEGQRGETESP